MSKKQLDMTVERFQNIERMLMSNDKESQVVALNILEEQDFNSNIAFILLARKSALCKNELWTENAPSVFKKLKSLDGSIESEMLTYKKILQILKTANAPFEQVEFYLETFSVYLKNQLHEIGYDFIDELELKIKIKSKDEKGNITSKGQ